MGADARRTMLAAALLAAALGTSCEKKETAAVAAPPTEVYVADVVQKDVPVYLEVVGQTVGYQDVEVRARVEGVLESMNFREGSFVRKGDLLYTIDRKPLEAILAAARADQATAEARLAKADNDVKRYRPLAAKQAVSQQELDDALAAQDAAKSQLEAAKAAVDKASLDLGYTRITAEISGLAGTTMVKPGNLVGRGENTLLTTISQIDPILFRIGITEADYIRVAQRYPGRAGEPPTASGIRLTLTDGTVYRYTGRVATVDRAVDSQTGTLGLQLEFPNKEQLLRPGQYGRARVLVETQKQALLVQQRAVQELQNLYSVAVVDGENKVGFRNVKVGQRVDSQWVINEGLKPGDRVIVEGLQRVRDGMTVDPKPAPVATTGNAAGQPGNEGKNEGK
ncbi:MAG TPA: efflux RND transporter periplasmic adaptor subunit [Vicinamibacterales bacterium]|nr:efflux RND transporter periplasmic adaptor subunit [Vicinamibacterales bacterium]